jgi:hypothetical protein
MANTYGDATGLLMFDGSARITPVIRLLFTPFKLGKTPEASGTEHYVAVLAEDNAHFWDSYICRLADAAEAAFGIHFNDPRPDRLLRELGAHLGFDLTAFVETIDLDTSVALADVVRLAFLLDDGHNLSGLCLEGCWHCDRPRLWEFGGFASYVSRRYALDLSTSELLDFARALDAGLSQDTARAAGAVVDLITRLASGLADDATRVALLQQVGAQLASTQNAAGG